MTPALENASRLSYNRAVARLWGHFLAVVGLLALMLAACAPPDRSAWPRVRVLLDPAARPFITDSALKEFARSEGAVFDLNWQGAETIPELLARGTPADVVLVTDPAVWRKLEQGEILAAAPWRFEYHRQAVLLVTAADGAPLQPVALENPADSVAGRLTERALKPAGLWSNDRGALIFCANGAGALGAVAAGRARSAAILSESGSSLAAPWRVARRIDPYPDWPAFAAAGVPARPTAAPQLARRGWSFLERVINRSEEGLTRQK